MKVLKILTISFCIIILLSHNVFALDEILSMGEDWESIGLSGVGSTISFDDLQDVSSKLYNILLVAATAVIIIIGVILGIQYMTAGISKKVEVKESLFPYIISSIVVFGSFGIWKLVVIIMSNI